MWGVRTNRLHIFADVATPAPIQTTATVTPIVHPNESFIESFNTNRFEDSSQTTALWNFEAGELNLPAGMITASAQSTKIASTVGGVVKVSLLATESRPAVTTITYQVSADGGQTWVTLANGASQSFTNPLGDWRFKILLDRGVAGISPSVQDIRLDFFVKN